jgi:predicted CopG family antitoxin
MANYLKDYLESPSLLKYEERVELENNEDQSFLSCINNLIKYKRKSNFRLLKVILQKQKH